jgi:hypothetical protein
MWVLRRIERFTDAANAFILVVLFACITSVSAGAQISNLADLQDLPLLSSDQWRALERGEAQARVLDTRGKHEVAVVGVTRMRATTACFVGKFEDIETFKKSPSVLRIGKCSDPQSLRQVEGFRLESRDIAELPSCRLGNCAVRLSAAAIQRLGRDAEWLRSGIAATGQAVWRDELVRYLDTYLSQGNQALIEYRDKSPLVRLADEFQALLEARPGVAEFAPEFREYLAQYPYRKLPGVADFLYWSAESFGLKPVTSITHVSILQAPGQAVIASKQLYASHYFEGSLGLTVALDDVAGTAQPGMYLLYLNRSRIDLLSGFWGGLRRLFLRGRLRDGLQENLREVARKIQASCTEPPAAASAVPTKEISPLLSGRDNAHPQNQ